MTIASGGNVGIGTTAPSDILSIFGGTSNINLGGNFGAGYNGIWMNGLTSTTGYNILSSSADPTLYINRPTGLPISFRESNVPQMTIASGGNVGIGTTAPAAKLEVKGTLTSSTGIINLNNSSNFVTNINTGTTNAVVNLGNSTGLGGITVGGGAVIKQILSTMVSLNFGNVSGGSSITLTIAVPGAVDGDPVALGVPNGSTSTNRVYTAWVSAPNTVSVELTNNSGGSFNPPAGNFRVTVFHY
jgi:hypothetical protein